MWVKKAGRPVSSQVGHQDPYPASTSGGTTPSNDRMSYGNPCSRMMGNPEASPWSSYPMLSTGVWAHLTRDESVIAILSGISAVLNHPDRLCQHGLRLSGKEKSSIALQIGPHLDSSLEAGVPDGLGDGSEAGIIGDSAPETVGDVPHSKAGLQIGPTDGCSSAPVAEGPQGIAG